MLPKNTINEGYGPEALLSPLKPKQGLTPDFLLRGPSHGSVCGFL
jgi:hypothetical protein